MNTNELELIAKKNIRTLELIKNKIEQLNTYRDAYYNKNKPLVSDKEYDKLFDELKALEDETGIKFSYSPTQSVGYEVVSKLQKVNHKIPLLSMNKTKSLSELGEFLGTQEFIAMWKADGLTNELIYDGGKLIQGSTRGSGEIGEDITHNCKTYKNIPLEISYKGYLRITGESVILESDFEKINENLEEKYKTPRNLTSGSVRQLDSKLCSERNVRFYAFGVDGFSKKSDGLEFLKELGFETVYYRAYNSLQDISNKMLRTDKSLSLEDFTLSLMTRIYKENAERDGFPIDGIVFRYNDEVYSKSLGSTSHHPLDSMAFKFEDETELTTLREIEWSVGRTGTITPVAIFDTVNLDGTEVSRASVHNLSIMGDLKLGVGDAIEVYKANMIIPQILKNHTQSGNIEIPDECPICKAETIKVTQNKSTVLMCTNRHCPSQLVARFSHFCSREAMNIDGLSESTIEKFINMGIIRTFTDIYNLEKHKDLIVNTEGFGERSYEKLINAINKSKHVKLNNYLYAMGIPNIGKSSAKTIAEYFNYDMISFFDALRSHFDFTQLKDFGEIADSSLYAWWADRFENDLRNGLGLILEFVEVEKKQPVVTDNPLSGKKVYPTGTFANFKKEELKQLLESLGAEITGGYAKSLDYLIVGSVKGSSKEDKAKKDNVKIMSEDELMKLI